MGAAYEREGGEPNRAGETPETVAPPTTETGTETSVTEEGSELERSIGLVGGLAVGVGTMIGAGIFVFPGIAAGQAGPAAAGSFAIGAVVALLVALPASELATAMPKSGGGYYFVSRALGATAGAIVDRSGEFDVIVMGEGEETLLTTVLGDTSERIAEGAVAPVLVVRRREES